MPSITHPQILAALEAVSNPEFEGRDIVALEQVSDIRVCAPIVSVTISLPNVGSEAQEAIRAAARTALLGLPEIETAEVRVEERVRDSRPPPAPEQPSGGRPNIATSYPPSINSLTKEDGAPPPANRKTCRFARVRAT